jgi:hypothetical protein
MALRRRCACQTIARNMPPISGTSVSSSMSSKPRTTSQTSSAPVDTTTTASTATVTSVRHTR